MKYEKSCGAFVFRIHENKDEVLLIRQVQGHWCFPKGHVEKDEKRRLARTIMHGFGVFQHPFYARKLESVEY